MTTFSEVDAALVDLGSRVFNGGPVKKKNPQRYNGPATGAAQGWVD